MANHDQAYWVNSVHHLYYGGDFQELFQAIQDGFLEDKLVHLGPAALVEDYDYAFRATQSSDSPADLLLVAAHRTLMTSRAALLDQDFQDTLCRLSAVGIHRHWLSWCIGLAEFIDSPPDKLALVSKLSLYTDGQDQARLLDTIRSASRTLSRDIRKRFDVSRAIESLSLIGEPGLALCLEVLLPVLTESPLQSLSGEVETIIKGILRLPPDRAAPLLNRVHVLMDEKGAKGNRLYVILAQAYFSIDCPQAAMMILEDLEGRYCGPVACDYAISVALLEAYASFEVAACRDKAAQLSTKLLSIARENKPPFENWNHFLSVAKLRDKIGLPLTSVAEALNEAGITIYRQHEDDSALMHPEPSWRCIALCSLAAESTRLGIPDMGQRLLMQAQAIARTNDRLGQRATELFRIACTFIEVGNINAGFDIARASIALFPSIKDRGIPHLRPGLEHDEALRRITESAAVFLGRDGDRDLLSSIFERINAVSYRPVRLDLLASFTSLAARLPDPMLISLVLDEAVNTSAADSDGVYHSERFNEDLIRACENASETVKDWLFPRIAAALVSLSGSHHLTSLAKIAARTVQSKMGTAGVGPMNQRIWDHGAAAKGSNGHRVLKALAAMAAEVDSFDTCERAVQRVFDNPIATSPDNCVRLLVLAAEACHIFGCDSEAIHILDHHGAHLLDMPDLVHRAEGQARLASAYQRVGERGQAVTLVESALLSMRENGKRSHGLFPYEFIAKACGEIGDRDGSRLLIDSVNTAVSLGDIMGIESAIKDFALACEGLYDRALALRLLHSLEDYGHRLLTLNPLGAPTIPAHAIAPVYVSRAHVLFRDSRPDEALRSLLRSVEITRDLLRDEHENGMFIVRALRRTCAECRKISDPAAAAEAINAVYEVATVYRATRESRKASGDLYWRELQSELAKTFLTIGEYQYADTVGAELNAEIVAGTDFLGPSYLVRELSSLLLHRHGIIRTDLLEMLRDEDLETIASEIVAHRTSISVDDRQAYFYALAKVASRLDTIQYARCSLAILPILQSLAASAGVVDAVNRLLARIGVTGAVG